MEKIYSIDSDKILTISDKKDIPSKLNLKIESIVDNLSIEVLVDEHDLHIIKEIVNNSIYEHFAKNTNRLLLKNQTDLSKLKEKILNEFGLSFDFVYFIKTSIDRIDSGQYFILDVVAKNVGYVFHIKRFQERYTTYHVISWDTFLNLIENNKIEVYQ